MIAIDLRPTQNGISGAHGGGEYIRSVLTRVRERELTDRFVAVAFGGRARNDYLRHAEACGLTFLYISSDRPLNDQLRAYDVTTFYSPLPYDLRHPLKGIRTVATIHGLRALEVPTDALEWRYVSLTRLPLVILKHLLQPVYWQWRRRQLENIVHFFDLIIVPSEHTKFSLLSLLRGVTEEKIRVLYSPVTAVSRIAETDDSVLTDYDLKTGGYVLLVSGGRFEKNLIRAVQAIDLLQASRVWPERLQIVVTGGRPRWLGRSYGRLARFPPYLSTEKLAALYRHARLLIYPTLSEGFGYPPLESLSHGTPVVASGLCSLPEINAAAIDYFDPRNIYDMATRILRAVLSAKGDLPETAQARIREVRVRQEADLDKLIDLLCAEAP